MQIAAGGDGVFARLAEAIGKPEWITDPRYARSRERIARADELERLLSDWIAAHDFAEIEKRLIGGNVPFGGIYTASDIVGDPHFAARDNIARIQDPEVGEVVMPAVVPTMQDTPGRIAHAGPVLGAHTAEILKGVLGKSDAEIAALKENGVI